MTTITADYVFVHYLFFFHYFCGFLLQKLDIMIIKQTLKIIFSGKVLKVTVRYLNH